MALVSSQAFWDYPVARLYAFGGLTAMRATSLLYGCLLSLGAVANAAATGGSAAASSMNASAGCTHNGSSEHGSSHDTSAASGDSLNVPHSAATSSPSSNHRSGNANSNVDDSPARFGGADNAPDGSSHGSSGLGWQSLLPGSIQ